MRWGLILAVAFAVCGAADGGSFPGRNGLIVVSRSTSEPQPALVAIDPATGAQQPLGFGVQPAWSPDGSKLAYARDGDVYVASADGSGAATVGEGDSPSWSPDGTHLVVGRFDGVTQPGLPFGIRQLYLLDLRDGSTTQLTELTEDAYLPAWSPDGSTIAFATPKELETIPAGGGTPTPLALSGVTINGGPSWSPDGRALAFLDSNGQVWTAAPDGSGARQLTYTLVGPNGFAARPAWSPDGGAIAFTAGADLCVTDLAGNVRRVTRNQQTTENIVASLPDWQPSAGGSGAIFAAPAGPNDTIGCDWNPGARFELLEANVSPGAVEVAAPQEVVFVNHLTRPLNVTTTLRGEHATIEPGRYFAFSTEPGEYTFTVSGYSDGVPRHGSFLVTAAGRVTAEQHAAIRYGDRTVLTGAAVGPAGGKVTVLAQAYGASRPTPVAAVTPAGGRWQLSVAPKITTHYRVTYEGATADRLLRVKPNLRVARRDGVLRVTLAPAAKLAGKTVFVFRLGGAGWGQYRSARIGRNGIAVVRGIPSGRYYVGFEGGDAYWGTATEPFTVHR